jgi:hypothetical protein
MRDDFAAAAKSGEIVKTQNFVTARGVYQLIFVKHEGNVFMYKHRNGELVECCNLSRGEKDDG